MSEMEIEKIFKFGVVISPMAMRESSGIGLSLVKKVLDRRGGGIEVQSQLGVGSTFTINFGSAGVAENHDSATQYDQVKVEPSEKGYH